MATSIIPTIFKMPRMLLAFLLIMCAMATIKGQDKPLATEGLTLETISLFAIEQMDPKGLSLANKKGWIYKSGHSDTWSEDEIKLDGWKKVTPTEIDHSYADENGRIEGWFRLKFKVDDSVSLRKLYLMGSVWAASEVYLDERLIGKFGEFGTDYASFKQFINNDLNSRIPVHLEASKVYTLAIHQVAYNIKDFQESFSPAFTFFKLVEDSYYQKEWSRKITFNIWIAISIFTTLIFCFFYVFNSQLEILVCISLCALLIVLLCAYYFSSVTSLVKFSDFYTTSIIANFFAVVCYFFTSAVILVACFLILGKFPKNYLFTFFFFFLVPSVIFLSHPSEDLFYRSLYIQALILAFILVRFVIKYRPHIKGAVVGLVFISLFGYLIFSIIPISLYAAGLINDYEIVFQSFGIGWGLGILGFSAFLALKLKENMQSLELKNAAIIEIESEKRSILNNQNLILEKKVSERTIELKESIDHLKSTQDKLIQSEKMASLGELTAGIAHEIQNPLNFVNNFSDLSSELVVELEEELEEFKEDNIEDAMGILEIIKKNVDKISHHGNRASSIVRGMLNHSRVSTDEKVLTDLNALCDEFLRLSYHGLRAKDKRFNCKLETDFDKSLPKIEVVPQEIGRVLLNIFNNAFYAVNKKGEDPKVKASTKYQNNQAIITISDNGIGMKPETKEKIFQPFFTTKPTGQGTGLGMSMTFDIITKGHGGEIDVTSEEGVGTTFTVKLNQ